MKRTHRIGLEIPVDNALQAFELAAVLEAITRALWAVHGEDMSKYLVSSPVNGDSPPEPIDDEDLPF